MVPSVSVSRQGFVMPFLDCWLLTTLAVRRNSLIWSLLRVGSSDATTRTRQSRNTIAARISRRHCRPSMCIGIPPPNYAHKSSSLITIQQHSRDFSILLPGDAQVDHLCRKETTRTVVVH